MDIPQIRKPRPKPTRFLKRFDDGFPRKDTRAHLPIYIPGQLPDPGLPHYTCRDTLQAL